MLLSNPHSSLRSARQLLRTVKATHFLRCTRAFTEGGSVPTDDARATTPLRFPKRYKAVVIGAGPAGVAVG